MEIRNVHEPNTGKRSCFEILGKGYLSRCCIDVESGWNDINQHYNMFIIDRDSGLESDTEIVAIQFKKTRKTTNVQKQNVFLKLPCKQI